MNAATLAEIRPLPVEEGQRPATDDLVSSPSSRRPAEAQRLASELVEAAAQAANDAAPFASRRK